MQLLTIRQITKDLGISTRTLRYYEQIGLIESVKKADYAYRAYNEESVIRLQQIILLRKLRIPLKQIGEILQYKGVADVIEIFRRNLNDTDEEISALSTIRDIISDFILRLSECTQNCMGLDLFDDAAFTEAVKALTVVKFDFKEGKAVEGLNKANDKLRKLTDREVRILRMPSATMAAYISGTEMHNEGREMPAIKAIDTFLRSNRLLEQNPETRRFGFYAHKPDENGDYSFELWVTVPDNMEIPHPLMRRHFRGGLYAAHNISMGEYEDWSLLKEWGNSGNENYEIDWSSRVTPDLPDRNWVLEEILNYNGELAGDYIAPLQVDLLLPIKEK